jgi:CDP-diacylglycerol--serine O-phosphatidyltransferase
VRFNSFKEIDLRNRVPFVVLLLGVLVFVVIFITPPLTLFGSFLIYTLFGVVQTLVHRRQRYALRRKAREAIARKRAAKEGQDKGKD